MVSSPSLEDQIQAMLEEDACFRTRYLWSQLNRGCAQQEGDLVRAADDMVKSVTGILGTDSKGGDAIHRNEGPLLGLSNVRSASQGFQLREQLEESLQKLIWLSGDWQMRPLQALLPVPWSIGQEECGLLR